MSHCSLLQGAQWRVWWKNDYPIAICESSKSIFISDLFFLFFFFLFLFFFFFFFFWKVKFKMNCFLFTCYNIGDIQIVFHFLRVRYLKDEEARKRGNPPWVWSPRQTSPEVKNRGISGPTKMTYVLQIFFKKKMSEWQKKKVASLPHGVLAHSNEKSWICCFENIPKNLIQEKGKNIFGDAKTLILMQIKGCFYWMHHTFISVQNHHLFINS